MTDEQIENVTFFAGNMMSISEVSMITGIDKSDEKFQKTYWKAWFTTEALINEKIKNLAISGSSSAQQLAMNIMKQKS
jgi:hypothetical protein